jgi:hypothetical protein
VVKTLAEKTAVPTSSTTSVKVPPISTPKRTECCAKKKDLQFSLLKLGVVGTDLQVFLSIKEKCT